FTYGNLVTTSPSSKCQGSRNFPHSDYKQASNHKPPTGGVYKIQGRIQRTLMTCTYEVFLVHEGKLQTSIPSAAGFHKITPNAQHTKTKANVYRTYPFGLGDNGCQHCK
ncbi:hypothetical protein ADUPG1_001822, partial [Aduncisulcus paluster]